MVMLMNMRATLKQVCYKGGPYMFLFIVILLFVFIALKVVIVDKISIDFKSFFHKGFKKNDNVFGLYCYTGKQGTGKTYSSVKFVINQKLRFPDTKIITNVKSFNVFNDTIYLPSIMAIISKAILLKKMGYDVIIFYDEIFSVLEKRSAMNKNILLFLSQLRKRGIIFVTTAQEWAEINLTFRRYVRYQIDCNMFSIFSYAFLFNSINDGYSIHWDEMYQDFIAPRISANFSKGEKRIIESYDTFETIHVS